MATENTDPKAEFEQALIDRIDKMRAKYQPVEMPQFALDIGKWVRQYMSALPKPKCEHLEVCNRVTMQTLGRVHEIADERDSLRSELAQLKLQHEKSLETLRRCASEKHPVKQGVISKMVPTLGANIAIEALKELQEKAKS